MTQNRSQLTVEMLVGQAKDQLQLSSDEVDQLRPIFDTQIQSLNRLRALKVDLAVEPDVVFTPEGGHE